MSESSTIKNVDYDAATQQLTVTFYSGAVYSYAGVPEHVYRDLMAAPSKGKFLRTAVIPSFKAERKR